MPFATNDDVDIYYEVDGPVEGDVVVFVEGLGYGRWMWRWQNEALAETFRTIRWDNRGTGRSDQPADPDDEEFGYSVEEMAADLEAVLADRDVERAHVVGASMGGMIAQRYALEYDRAETLTLACTSPGGDEAVETPPEVREHIASAPDGYGERELLRHRMEPATSDGFAAENDALVERIVDWRLEGDADEAGRLAQLAAVAEFDAGGELDRIDVPTLVLHGTEDRVLPVENARILNDRLPNAELALFEGAPHLFFVERSDAVNDAMIDFLEEHARTQ